MKRWMHIKKETKKIPVSKKMTTAKKKRKWES